MNGDYKSLKIGMWPGANSLQSQTNITTSDINVNISIGKILASTISWLATKPLYLFWND